MIDDTNIENSYKYRAEEAKANFQYTLNDLFEVKVFLSEKRTKDGGLFLTPKETKFLDEWISRVSSGLMADYVILERLNREAFQQYDVVKAYNRMRRSNLKSLAL